MSAPQITTNTFSGGMNQDTAWDFFKPNEYREAVNFRPTADEEGDSTGSLSLIKGNALNFPFPSVYQVQTFEATTVFIDTYLDGTSQTITFDIDGASIAYDFAEKELDNFYNNFVTFLRDNFPTLVVQTNGSKILIYNPNGNSVINITEHNATVSTDAVTNKLVVLGYTRLREEAIIFTCPIEPDGSGQIWKVEWDQHDRATITLVRHASDNFSPEYEIEAKSRYENTRIKRAYWTDFNNEIRGINIVSDSTFLDIVNLIPAINYDVPVITELKQTGGALPSGWYSYAYRLKNLAGSETTISRFSPMFPISDNNEVPSETEHWLLKGSNIGVETKKYLIGTIENLDTTYEFLDIIVAYTASEDGVPFYYIVEENVSIDGDPTYTFNHGSNDGLITLTEAELISPTAFRTCKSIEILNNRLYAANLKSKSSILNDYDFTSIRTRVDGSNEGYASTDDKINPYNKDSTSAVGITEQHKFKGDVRGGTWVLGGIGELVDFEFITQQFRLDSDRLWSTRQAMWRLYESDTIDSLPLNGINYPMGNLWNSYKNPFFTSIFRGYMRSEIYRFGIEFFDSRGNTLGVKWIADIRMPEQADFPAFEQEFFETEVLGGIPVIDSRLHGNALGVKFTVRVPEELQSQCSGFRIVRANREKKDETIAAQTLIEDVAGFVKNNEVWTYRLTPQDSYFGYETFLQEYGGITTVLEKRLKFSNIPQFAFTANASEDLSQYKLRPVASMQSTTRNTINRLYLEVDSSNSEPSITIDKYWTPQFLKYSSSENVYLNNSLQLNNSLFINAVNGSNPSEIRYEPMITSDIDDNRGPFINYSFPERAGVTDELICRGRGNKGYLMSMSEGEANRAMSVWSNLGLENDPENSSIQPKYSSRGIFNLYRELINQYGGDTKGAIESTKYIPVGHYQAITPGVSEYDCEVFGGDTYINIYDERTMTPHDTRDDESARVSADMDFVRYNLIGEDKKGYGWIYPIESRINMDLRTDSHMAVFGQLDFSTEHNLTDKSSGVDLYGSPLWLSDYQRTDFGLSLSSFSILADEFDNRVIVSQAKTNGESIDSWSEFRVLDDLDVDGNHGPINKIGVLNDKLLFWQDRAFGYILSNPRIQTQGTDDISVQLGVSQDALFDYDYISRKIGTYHQKSVFQSPTGWYWFDINNKRPYKYGGSKGIEEYAEMKGMHSFFSREVDNNLLKVERNPFGQGIHGTYDYTKNEALFTFNSPKVVIEQGSESYDANFDRFPALYIPVGTHVSVGGQEFVTIKSYYAEVGNLVPPSIVSDEYLLELDDHISKGFTLAMNHLTQKWSSFYGFKPNIYINVEDKILSPDPNNQDQIYLHDAGDYSTFYGEKKDAKLKLVVNKEPLSTKVWDNISWHNKTRDVSGTRGRALDTSTFSEFYCHTDYQHSGNITLQQDGIDRNLTKVEGEWRMAVPANVVTETGSDVDVLDPNNWDTTRIFKDRMRDKYILQSFTYKPENAQFILDYINNYFRVSHR